MARTRQPATLRLKLRQRAARARDAATKSFLRSEIAAAKKTVRSQRRQADLLARQASILGRGRTAATRATIASQATALRRQAREIERAAAAEYERPLQFLRVPAARRSSYQRRNVSRARQIERGERPNLGTAVESNRARIARLTDEQVIEQFQLRVRQLWPNSENYENSFRRLDHLPDLVRVMSTLSDSQLRTLIVQREGADFNIELAHMMRVQMAPVAVTRNPLHYHDSSRTDYGI